MDFGSEILSPAALRPPFPPQTTGAYFPFWRMVPEASKQLKHGKPVTSRCDEMGELKESVAAFAAFNLSFF